MRATTAENPGSSVAVNTTSTPVVATSEGRDYLALVNDSDVAIYIRLADSGAAVGQGIRLSAAGGSWDIQGWAGPVCAVHGGTGTKNLCVVEV